MVKIEFETNNSAFVEPDGSMEHEVKRILNVISKKIACGRTGGNILDLNGNSIGSWSLAK